MRREVLSTAKLCEAEGDLLQHPDLPRAQSFTKVPLRPLAPLALASTSLRCSATGEDAPVERGE